MCQNLSQSAYVASFFSPGPYVSFGHVVGETKGFGRNEYRMNVNLGHPAGHAHLFQVSIIVREGREDIGIMDAFSVDHFEEAFKRL